MSTEPRTVVGRGTPRRIASATGIVAALLTSLVATEGVEGQAPGAFPQASYLPASTRAMGLGDAYPMTSGHADALFYHPSLLTEASGFGLGYQRWGPESTASALSGAAQWLGGGVGLGLRTLQYNAAGSGAAAAPGGQDHLFERGSVPVSERIATVGYARAVPFGLDLGVAVELGDVRIGSSHESRLLVDVGVSTEVGPVVVGLTAQDIGAKPLVESGSAPARYVLGGGAYGQQVGPLDLGYAATVGWDDIDERVTWGAGVEVGYWPIQGRTFVARFGLHDDAPSGERSLFTTGFAFWGDDITVEWAWHPFDGAPESGSHRFGLRWR